MTCRSRSGHGIRRAAPSTIARARRRTDPCQTPSAPRMPVPGMGATARARGGAQVAVAKAHWLAEELRRRAGVVS